ncbi:MAG TPA: thioredoxin [bacterium]|nr:thioredoxin [bacterium]HOL47228.1 thioredoxin [bacterium]HPQ18263.1 thioredoxin [bacterium]
MSEKIIYLNSQNFNSTISSGIVLVDFYADWCGPCKMLAPVIEELAEDFAGKAKICKLNTDENQEIAMNYNIRGIPTVIIFKDGEIKETLVGLRAKSEYEKLLNKYL